MRARTFAPDGEGTVEVTIVKGPSSTGMCIVEMDGGKKIARHKDRLSALDEESRELLTAVPKE